MRYLLCMLLCFLLASCAGTTQFQQYPALDMANTPTAVVHVVRAKSLWGCGVTAPVYVDHYLIGRIGPGGYLRVRVPVGRVAVTSTTADIILQTEQDKNYYIEVSMPVQTWFYAPDFNISLIDRNRAREILGRESLP